MAKQHVPPTQSAPATLEQWAQAAVHTVTCPSGAVVKIKLPDLEAFIAGDALPEHLRAVAWQQISEGIEEMLRHDENGAEAAEPSAPGIDQEMVKKTLEVRDWILLETIVEPELEQEHLKLLPAEDKVMIGAIAQRERDTDARGVTIGVAPLSRFHLFRTEHKCAEGCPACEEVRRIFSTTYEREL